MKSLLALLADWANGIFALLGASWLTGTDILFWHVPIALLLASLPDIDAIPELITRGKVASSREHERDHRTFLHYPVVACVFVVALWWQGSFFAVLTAIALVLHLLNDLYGTGWGLPLFWPLSGTHYKLLMRRVNRLQSTLVRTGEWNTLEESERRLRVLVAWSKAELPAYIRRWGQEDWIDDTYCRVTWISVIEFTLFAMACALLALYFWW